MSRLLCWLVAMAVVQSLAIYGGRHLSFNVTPSLPRGLYWRLARPAVLVSGMLLELSPPDAVLAFMETFPVDTHLLKQVAGVAGDTVCWRADTMGVNHQLVVLRLATHPLSPGLEGCRTLTPNELVVLGQHPQSVDSRDIGPIDRRRVLYRLVPVWTWGGAA